MPRLDAPSLEYPVERIKFKKARILSINPDFDVAKIEILENGQPTGQIYNNVPIFYHCHPEAELLENGSLEGASRAFFVGDTVIVRFQDENPMVIAPSELRTCGQYKLRAWKDNKWYYISLPDLTVSEAPPLLNNILPDDYWDYAEVKYATLEREWAFVHLYNSEYDYGILALKGNQIYPVVWRWFEDGKWYEEEDWFLYDSVATINIENQEIIAVFGSGYSYIEFYKIQDNKLVYDHYIGPIITGDNLEAIGGKIYYTRDSNAYEYDPYTQTEKNIIAAPSFYGGGFFNPCKKTYHFLGTKGGSKLGGIEIFYQEPPHIYRIETFGNISCFPFWSRPRDCYWPHWKSLIVCGRFIKNYTDYYAYVDGDEIYIGRATESAPRIAHNADGADYAMPVPIGTECGGFILICPDGTAMLVWDVLPSDGIMDPYMPSCPPVGTTSGTFCTNYAEEATGYEDFIITPDGQIHYIKYTCIADSCIEHESLLPGYAQYIPCDFCKKVSTSRLSQYQIGDYVGYTMVGWAIGNTCYALYRSEGKDKVWPINQGLPIETPVIFFVWD